MAKIRNLSLESVLLLMKKNKFEFMRKFREYALDLCATDRRIDHYNYISGNGFYFTASTMSAVEGIFKIDRMLQAYCAGKYRSEKKARRLVADLMPLILKTIANFESISHLPLLDRVGRILYNKKLILQSKYPTFLENFSWCNILSIAEDRGNCGFTTPNNIRFVYKYLLYTMGFAVNVAAQYNIEICYE